MDNLYVPNLSGMDPQTARLVRDLVDRTNYLTTELDRVRGLVMSASPGVDAAKRENPIPGVLSIPCREYGGQDGFIRVNKDGVIQSYVNPIESLFPYVDITVVTNITTGLDLLHSFTLPAGTLANDGDMLWVRYGGTFGVNDNDKRIRIEFGGQLVSTTGGFDQDTGNWVYDILYTRTSPTTVKFPLILHWGSGNRDGAGTLTGNFVFAGDFVGIAVANLNTTNTLLTVQAEGTATSDIAQGLSFINLIRPRTVKLV